MPKRARSPSKDRSAKIKKLKRQLSRMQAHLDRLVTSDSSSDSSESSAERRKDLLTKHLLPENCKALNPPKLNEEIRSLLPTYALKNDHFLPGLQEQLGAGMAILGSILSQKLGSPESELILADEAVEELAEADQLFANVHQAVSSKRIFEINPFLDTDCRSAAVKASVDDYLFGSDFLGKVKANREMKKAADEIKKPDRSIFTST
nr:unnamed protein product [Callosobruchus analis]